MRSSVPTTLAASLSSRRGATGWLVGFALLTTLLFGLLSSVPAATHSATPLPAENESARVTALLEQFEGSGRAAAVLVAERADGAALTGADERALAGLAAAIREPGRGADAGGALSAGQPVTSDDGQAALLAVSWDSRGALADRDQVAALRELAAGADAGNLRVLVTGGAAFGLDLANAFDGADFTLLAVTVGVVALLLVLTYRSPILWLIPLLVVALADRAASLVTRALAGAWNLHFDTGVLSVLVFGAGANYALLLISRYRDELHATVEHRAALAAAWRGSFGAILTSNLTVVPALASLGLAAMEDTRGLGIACAVGLLIALLFTGLLLPAVLAVCGRKVFWPLVPSPDRPAPKAGRWERVARQVTARPGLNLGAALAILAILAAALTGTSLGLKPADQFRGQAESATGARLLAAHFDVGEAYPHTVLARASAADAVAEAAQAVPGINRVGVLDASTDGSWRRLLVAGSAEPGTAAGFAEVEALRQAVHAVPGADALVGGQPAQAHDIHRGHLGDVALIAPLVAGICLLMLLALTRSWRTALLLALVNLFSAAGALGLGALAGSLVFDVGALDVQVPLLAFLFLVALGVDYTIFLVHRIRQEAAGHPMRTAVIRTVGATGTVITSAGVVLAGVFAALATLPLMVLGQLGLIVGLGVLLDTFLVRTVLLPALFTLLGHRALPGSAPRTRRTVEKAAGERAAVPAVPGR